MNDWKGMKVVLLGAGSAVPDPVRGNPSQAVVIDGEVMVRLADGVHGHDDVEIVR